MKEKFQISFSGGRTSAYMTKMLLEKYSHIYDFIVTFANTGLEDEGTLRFIKNCDDIFGFNTVWLEAVVNPEKGKGTGFKVVSYETASRKGEPFEDVIKKYGIPNKAYPHCTRELKLQVMRSYLKSLNINHKTIVTAVGIREDEKRRVSKTHEEMNIIYPLIDDFPTDKQDVLDWWGCQSFDLEIEEWNGNCKGCFKKSFKKLFLQLDDNPDVLDFQKSMEEKYPQHGNSSNVIEIFYKDDHGENLYDEQGEPLSYFTKRPDRVFFRGNTSTVQLMNMWRGGRDSGEDDNPVESGGCSESCEVYFAE